VQARLSCASAQAGEVHHVFAAGDTGFFSSKDSCDAEFAAWTTIVDELLMGGTPERCLHVHLISSAGGLFEGQLNVSRSCPPAPLRPYGQLKLAQEQILLDRLGAINSHIYRLSSVYGNPHPNHRNSLIGNLIVNSFAHRVTQVIGNLDTLRDYLPAADAARFIADRILNRGPVDPSPVTLASGRSASILEVLRIIEQTTKRRPLITLAEARNAASVSFRRDSLPDGFQPTDLRTKIGSLLRSYVGGLSG